MVDIRNKGAELLFRIAPEDGEEMTLSASFPREIVEITKSDVCDVRLSLRRTMCGVVNALKKTSGAKTEDEAIKGAYEIDRAFKKYEVVNALGDRISHVRRNLGSLIKYCK